MKCYIYIIGSKQFPDNHFKVGFTVDPKRRINDGCYTTAFVHPCQYVFLCEFERETAKEGMKIEKEIHNKLSKWSAYKKGQNRCTEMYRITSADILRKAIQDNLPECKDIKNIDSFIKTFKKATDKETKKFEQLEKLDKSLVPEDFSEKIEYYSQIYDYTTDVETHVDKQTCDACERKNCNTVYIVNFDNQHLYNFGADCFRKYFPIRSNKVCSERIYNTVNTEIKSVETKEVIVNFMKNNLDKFDKEEVLENSSIKNLWHKFEEKLIDRYDDGCKCNLLYALKTLFIKFRESPDFYKIRITELSSVYLFAYKDTILGLKGIYSFDEQFIYDIDKRERYERIEQSFKYVEPYTPSVIPEYPMTYYIDNDIEESYKGIIERSNLHDYLVQFTKYNKSFLVGAAGCGKTFQIARYILAMDQKQSIGMYCFSGKAASVLKKTLLEELRQLLLGNGLTRPSFDYLLLGGNNYGDRQDGLGLIEKIRVHIKSFTKGDSDIEIPIDNIFFWIKKSILELIVEVLKLKSPNITENDVAAFLSDMKSCEDNELKEAKCQLEDVYKMQIESTINDLRIPYMLKYINLIKHNVYEAYNNCCTISMAIINNKFDEKNYDVLFLDEAGTIDLYNLSEALKFKYNQLVLSGDTNQLPPIASRSIFDEIIPKDDGKSNITTLRYNFRSRKQPSLIALFNKVRQNRNISKSSIENEYKICTFNASNLKEQISKLFVKDTKILVSEIADKISIFKMFDIKYDRDFNTKLLDTDIQIMGLKNKYGYKCNKRVLQYYNGQEVKLDEVNAFKKAKIKLERSEIMTIQKSQGMSIKNVILVISKPISHNAFYTAITRARENLHIFYHEDLKEFIEKGKDNFPNIEDEKFVNLYERIKKVISNTRDHEGKKLYAFSGMRNQRDLYNRLTSFSNDIKKNWMIQRINRKNTEMLIIDSPNHKKSVYDNIVHSYIIEYKRLIKKS